MRCLFVAVGKREGGMLSFTATKGGGANKVLAMLKGGHNKFWGRFFLLGNDHIRVDPGLPVIYIVG